MGYEWDEAKAAANVAKHRLSFSIAPRILADPAVLLIDTSRPEDSEVRYKGIGLVGQRLMAVVYTMRENTVRVISVRRANQKEMREYADR